MFDVLVLAVDVPLHSDDVVEDLCLLEPAFLIDWVRRHVHIRAIGKVTRQVLFKLTLPVPSKTLRLQPLVHDSSHIESPRCLAEARIAVLDRSARLIAVAQRDEAIIPVVLSRHGIVHLVERSLIHEVLRRAGLINRHDRWLR